MFNVRRVVAIVVAAVLIVIGMSTAAQAETAVVQSDTMPASLTSAGAAPAPSTVSPVAQSIDGSVIVAALAILPMGKYASASMGGAWYQTNSFYSTQVYSGGLYRHTIKWSCNRTLFVGHPYYDNWSHKLFYLKVTDGYTTRTLYWPSCTTTVSTKGRNVKITARVITAVNGTNGYYRDAHLFH